MSYVQLSEGGFQVAYPLGLWSRFSGVDIVLYGVWLVNHLHLHGSMVQVQPCQQCSSNAARPLGQHARLARVRLSGFHWCSGVPMSLRIPLCHA